MKTPSTTNNSLTPTKPNTSSSPMNTPKTSHNRTSAIILAGSIAALLAVQSAHAATRNWDGDTSTAWSDALNWDTLPTNDLTTDIANFNLAAYGSPYVAPFLPNAGTTSINGLTIGSSNGKMILSTANLRIGAGGITIASGAGAFNVAGAVTLGAAQSWVNNSRNHFMIQSDTGPNDVVDNGGFLLTIEGTGHTRVGQAINGAGGLTKTGTGILTIDTANATGGIINGSPTLNGFTGQLTVANGTLAATLINNASAVGALGNSALSVILGSSGQTGIFQYTGITASSTKAFTMATSGTGAFDVALAATNLTLNGTTDQINGTGAMTKTGFGTLTISGSASNTFSGGLNVIGGGTLALDFANMGTPTDLITNTNALTLNGGFMTIKAKTGAVTTAQTFGGVTANAGGGSLLVDPLSAGGTTNVALGALSFGGTGSSLVLGRANTNTGTLNITTATDYDAQSIYGARTVFASGAAGTGYDWATRDSAASTPFTLAAFGTGGNFGTYTIMGSGGANDLANVETGILALIGSNTHNSLKITSAAALDLDVNQLTLASGGLLSTGTVASTISGTGALGLTAGAGTGYELIVHQYNTAANGLTISAVIGNNGANAVSVTKAGTGNLILSGANTFTGQLTVQGGTLSIPTINDVSTDGTLGNSASAVIIGNAGRVRYTGNTASSEKPFTMAAGGAGSFEVSTVGQTLTLSGVIGGAGGLQMTAAVPATAAGILKLTGLNTYTGVTTITGQTTISGYNPPVITPVSGILEVNNLQNAGVASSLGAYAMPGASGIVLNGGTLRYTGPSMGTSIDRGITLTANSRVDLPNSSTDMRIGSLAANGAAFNLGITGSASSRLYIDSLTMYTANLNGNGSSRNGINLVPILANVTIGSVTGNGNLVLAGNSTDNVITGPINLGRGHFNQASGDRTQLFGPWQGPSGGSGAWTIQGENTFDGAWYAAANILKIKSPGSLVGAQNVSYAFGRADDTVTWAGTTEALCKFYNGNTVVQLLNDLSTSYEYKPGARVSIRAYNATFNVGPQGTATNQTHKLGNLWIHDNNTNVNVNSINASGAVTANGYGLTFDVVRIRDGQTGGFVANTTLGLESITKGSGTGTSVLKFDGPGTTSVTGTAPVHPGGTLNITKQGGGTLIFNGSNTYNGTTAVTGGMLVAGHANALGTTAVNTAVSSGATLDVRAALVAEPISVTGTGVGAAGALITAATFTGSVAGPVTLTGTTSIGGAGTLAINGAIGGGFNVTKVGAGVTTFAGLNTYSGTTTVSLGTLVAAHADALGTEGSNTAVSNNATLDVRAALAAEPISITGTGVGGFGALITPSTFIGTVIGELTLTGAASIGGAGSTGALNINGLVTTGGNTLTTLGTGVTTFGAASDLTSLTNLVVADGTTNVNSALGTAGNTTVDVSDLGNGTKLRFGSVSQTLSSLTIGAGATVIFTSGLASGALTGDDGGGKAAGFGSPASSFGGGATVPEPGTLGLLLVGALGMLNRRRRA